MTPENDNPRDEPRSIPPSYYGKVLLYHLITYSLALLVLVVTALCSLVNPIFALAGIAMVVYFVIFRHGTNLRLCKARWAKENTGPEGRTEAERQTHRYVTPSGKVEELYYEEPEEFPTPPDVMPEGWMMCPKPYCGALIRIHPHSNAPVHECYITGWRSMSRRDELKEDVARIRATAKKRAETESEEKAKRDREEFEHKLGENRKAADAGDAHARFRVACMLSSRDRAASIQYLRLAMKDDDLRPIARFALVTSLAEGRLSEQIEARNTLLDGAEAGEVLSQYEVGLGFLNGKYGFASNPLNAAKWFETASLEWEDAAFELARLFEKGLGCERSLVKSFAYCTFAICTFAIDESSAGHDGATNLLKQIEPLMTPLQIQEGERAAEKLKAKRDEKHEREVFEQCFPVVSSTMR